MSCKNHLQTCPPTKNKQTRPLFGRHGTMKQRTSSPGSASQIFTSALDPLTMLRPSGEMAIETILLEFPL